MKIGDRQLNGGLNHVAHHGRWLWAGIVFFSFGLTQPASAQTNFGIARSFGFPALSTGANPIPQLIQGADGALYGTATKGGSDAFGVVFSVQANGTGYQVLHAFAGGPGDGQSPQAELLQGVDGDLYGTTFSGGEYGYGTIFRLGTNGITYSVLHSFATADGIAPRGGLLQAREDGVLFGTTSFGGPYGGTLFKINPDGSGFNVVLNFSTYSGAQPISGLLEATDGVLYGTTVTDGAWGNGTIFTIRRNGSAFSVMYNFTGGANDGIWAQGRMVEGPDGFLYGTTMNGGNPSPPPYTYLGNGTVYKIRTNAFPYQVIYKFPTANDIGGKPIGGLRLGADGWLYGAASAGGTNGGGTIYKMTTNGASVTVLHNLTSNDGTVPQGALIQGADGRLYGTASEGGRGAGTAFGLSTSGTGFSVLHNFILPNGGDAQTPQAPVSLSGCRLFGTTYSGGSENAGTVFALNLNGTGYALLHSFTNGNGDGYSPSGAVIKGNDGAWYGTTTWGGTNAAGTVFKLAAEGSTYAVLHHFAGTTSDGSLPLAGLIQGRDGGLYGTTSQGGANSVGTVFRLSTNGSSYSVLRHFAGGTDGAYPTASLIQGRDALLYGTASSGGTSDQGTVFVLATNGSGYKTLHKFKGGLEDGAIPQAGLYQANDGILYGTATSGGTNGYGIVFQMNTNGTIFKQLCSFDSTTSGGTPQSTLIQATNGRLYGTCQNGGANSDGTVFKVSTNGTGFAVVHTFSDPECRYPCGGLVAVGNGSLWGAANAGGAQNLGAIFHLGKPDEILAAGSFNASGLRLSFSGGIPGQTYQLLASTNLIEWISITAPTTDGTGSFLYQDTGATNYPRRFYRAFGP